MITKKSAVISVILLLLVVLSIGLLLVRGNSRAISGHVVINNLGQCSKNTTDGTINDVETSLYKLVKSANDYNKKSTAKHYTGSIRTGGCQNSSQDVTDNTTNKTQTIRTSIIIVDVPDAKQSWKLTYDWVTKGTGTVYVDLGTIQPSCLATNELLYGEFNCQSVLNLTDHGTAKVDPILQYMPYTGVGFRMEYAPDTNTVSVFFDPPPGTTDPAAFITNTKAIIPYWFQKRNLDQSKYKITYSDQIDSPDDNQQ